MPKYSLATTITAISPISITEPGLSYWDPETGYVGNRPTGFPCARTKRIPVGVNSDSGELSEENGAAKNNVRFLPYLPGNSLRGAIRRNAADIVMDILKTRGEKLSFTLYHILLCGAASASPGRAANISEAENAAKNPVAALLGGGPHFLWSKYSMGLGYPVTKVTIAAGFVPDHFAGKAINGNLIYGDFFVKKDDVKTGGRPVPSAVVDNWEEEAAAWLKHLEGGKERKKAEAKAKSEGQKIAAEDEGGKVELSTVAATEAIIPGVTFYGLHLLDTDLGGEAMLGLFLLSWERLAQAQRLGGNWRKGYGRFLLNMTVKSGDVAFEPFAIINGQHELRRDQPEVAAALAAWDAYAAKLTANDINKAFQFEV